jgi:hypothetical protein
MWIARELLRLLGRITVAVAIAVVIAEVRAIISGGGDTFWTFRVVLMLLGGLMLLLAGTGTGSAASRRVNWGVITPGAGKIIFRGFQPRPEDPTLTPAAVFVGSGAALLALGAAL